MKNEQPERIEISIEILSGIADKAVQVLDETEVKYLRYAIETLAWLTIALQKSRVSVKRLREAFFGPKSEKTEDVLDGQGGAADDGQGDAKSGKGKEGASGSGKGEKKEKPKGHGRNAAAAYTGAEKVHVCSDTLKPGAVCPECGKGKVYQMATPKVIVNVTGQAPLGATVITADRLRCNICLKVFSPELPAEARDCKYDESCTSTIAQLKYGSGLPFNRIEDLQASYGIPLPSSTQWDLVNSAASKLQPVHEEMIRQAAQGEVIHNDDTTMRILSLMGPIKGLEVETERPSDRTGIFTTGIMSVFENRTIGLFFTGWRHAGENLAQVLAKRDEGLEAAIQMCDALSRNTTPEFKTILANCNAHARREFVPLATIFPSEVRYVLETLAEVYKVDAEAKAKQLSAVDRLVLHQTESGPVMEELKTWLDDRFKQKLVEPNSSLGQAIKYMRKHWEKLTLFLHKAGCPLDNNICERLIKRALLHRKNAYFYRTENGARVGDLFMSLIYTAKLAGASPFHYLTQLQKHAKTAALSPERWMPWNYLDALASCGAEEEVEREAAG